MPTASRAVAGVVVVASLLGAGCTSGSDGGSGAGGTRAACRPAGGERAAKAVLRCTEASVAFIETEAATGTGVVVEAGGRRYILTNLHVVDPFDAADVTLGSRTIEDLAVVGADAAADIAVLGPLAGNDLPEPLPIGDGTALERGDEVFLVGFPGEADADDLVAAIASGIVSRLREVKEFGQSYIQTDASIGGGQSGGPLFDGSGNLVGISGLSFAEEFALALSGRDTKESLARILAGKGDDLLSLPGGGDGPAGAGSGTLRLAEATDGQVLFLPSAAEERTWHLTVDMTVRPIVSVGSMTSEAPLAASGNAGEVNAEVSRQLAALRGGRPDELFDPTAEGVDPKLAARETRPGRFTIPVKADESALVFVMAPLIDGPVDVAWESDLPLYPASRPVVEERLAVGGVIDRVLGGLDTSVDVLVELAEGQRVSVHARSPQGDPAFEVYTPTDRLDHLTVVDTEGAGIELFDDTDEGLYGLDARTTYKAGTAGTYRFRVYSNDLATSHIRFSVADCGDDDADCD